MMPRQGPTAPEARARPFLAQGPTRSYPQLAAAPCAPPRAIARAPAKARAKAQGRPRSIPTWGEVKTFFLSIFKVKILSKIAG